MTELPMTDEMIDDTERSTRIAEYKRAIEAIALVSHDPVPHELLAQLLEQPTALVEQWCDELARQYEIDRNGFELVRVAGGVRYQTAADLTPYVERFLLNDQRARLSGAALDTLAIIAYKQPISRAQVAAIRGVDPDGVLRTLQARGYIDEIGRDDGPGQAILFGTTSSFLEKLGLESTDDLPPIAEFIPGPDVVEALEHGLRVTPAIDIVVPAPVVPSELTEPSAAPVTDQDTAGAGAERNHDDVASPDAEISDAPDDELATNHE
ncbi:MAG: segregation and condensation protein B [Candidatus Aldehydirespiratoraceae bacterium]|jgi:segregation and condensation protein B